MTGEQTWQTQALMLCAKVVDRAHQIIGGLERGGLPRQPAATAYQAGQRRAESGTLRAALNVGGVDQLMTQPRLDLSARALDDPPHDAGPAALRVLFSH